MNDKNYKVFVIGGDHYNTYGIVRSLGEEGITCIVLILGSKSSDSFVLCSKYVETGQGCNNHAEVIAYLNSNYDSNRKNIIICCSDEAEELVIKNYFELSRHFVLPVCKDYQETSRLMNKASIIELAKLHAIQVPETWSALNRELPVGVKYPCITKPIKSTSGHKSDIVKCKSEKDLCGFLHDPRRGPDYVVQEYIEYDKEISVLGAVLADGEVLLSGCIEKLRTCMIGTTSFGVMRNNDLLGENIAKLKVMMKDTGYQGLFSAEFLVKGSNVFFLEVNFRNDGNTYISTASGRNLPLYYVRSIVNEDYGEDKPNFPFYFMLEIEDFLTLRQNHVSLWQWRRDLKRAKTCLVYNKLDLKPFRHKIKKTILSIIQRLWLKFTSM